MGSKTTTNNQVNAMDPLQQAFMQQELLPVAKQIASKPYEPYTGQRVAEPTQMMQQAYQGYQNLQVPEAMQAAAGTAQQRGQAIADIQQQMAPMLNRQYAQAGVGQEAGAIKAGAFGDRRSVYEGERQAALDAQAFNLASQELDRRAAQGVQGLQTQQAILAAQMGTGEAQRQLQQAQLDVGFEDYMRRQQYPLTQFGVLTGAAGAFPAGIGSSTSTATTRDPMGAFGMGLQAFGGLGMAGIGPFSGLAGQGLTSNPLGGLR